MVEEQNQKTDSLTINLN